MTPSIAVPSPAAATRIGGFTLKLFVALALVAVADVVFGGGGRFGSASAAFGAAWLVGLWLTRPATRRGGALVAFSFAWAMVFVLIEDPNALAALLFWGGVAMTALLPRAARFGDALHWAYRLLRLVAGSLRLPFSDAATLRKARPRRKSARAGKILATLALPVSGALLFSLLFAQANPIISGWFASYRQGASSLTPSRALFWLAVALVVWASLRQTKLLRVRAAAPRIPFGRAFPETSAASVLLSLVTFNILFAIENALDVAFLWSGAPLPAGVTLADYAHRGAYPLIATALLAGAFVLAFLRPGAPGADSPTVRKLVYLWIAQNILLVASSALRTIDYVEVYSLTVLRLSALIWMGLVALGLALICWRIFRRKSAAWLINANALALLATLSVCAFVDLGEATARWNVRHADRFAGQGGTATDVRYLESLGQSALLSLIELEDLRKDARDGRAVSHAQMRVMSELIARQADWRSWTWRGARRLSAAEKALADRQLSSFTVTPVPDAGAGPDARPADQ